MVRATLEAETVNTVFQKLRSRSGFSLGEMLITVLILLMVSSVVAGGIPAAANAYTKAVDAANAHVLLSTTVNALRDEFATAWDVKESDGAISYYSSDNGSRSKIYIGAGVDAGKIMIQEYLPDDDGLLNDAITLDTGRQIVSDAATIKGKLKVTCSKITYDNTKHLVSVENLAVSKASGSGGAGTVIVEMPETGFYIRVLSEEATE